MKLTDVFSYYILEMMSNALFKKSLRILRDEWPEFDMARCQGGRLPVISGTFRESVTKAMNIV